ncbi:2121_t:CDS:10, partial [Dentiscutata heterogama]
VLYCITLNVYMVIVEKLAIIRNELFVRALFTSSLTDARIRNIELSSQIIKDMSFTSEEVAINITLKEDDKILSDNENNFNLGSINLYSMPLKSENEREISRRKIFFLNENDIKLFENIQKWINKKEPTTLEETIEYQLVKMTGQENRLKTTIGYQLLNNPYARKVDAIAKTFFADHLPDFILKYFVDNDEKKKNRRDDFIKLLLRVGLVVEEETKSDDENIKYVKVFAPFKLLCDYAEPMKLDFPLKSEDHKPEPENYKTLNKWFLPNLTFITLNKYKLSAPFKKKYLEKFEGGNEMDSFLKFFSSARRNLLVDYIMNVANHIVLRGYVNEDKIKDEEEKDNTQVFTKNLKRLSNVFAISTLLREKVFTDYYPLHDGSISDKNSLRTKLNDSWIKNWKSKPLDQIRDYFGEKLALYFVFLGLVSSKNIGTVSSIVDNALTVPFALFMTLWSTAFLEYWKRANNTLQYNWDVMDYEEEELPRPEFYGTERRPSPITGKEEMYFPFRKKIRKFMISGIIISVSLCIFLITSGVLLIFPKIWIHIGIYTSVTTAILYSNLSLWLTDFENHRTETAYEDSLILKIFLFDFVNFYTALLYVILLKQEFIKDMIHNSNVTTGCEYDNCFTELTVQLAIIMIGKQAFGQISEVLIPLVKSRLNKDTLKQVLGENDIVPQWVEDDHLDEPPQIQDSEYMEIVFPLAPLFAWLNNVVEFRTDAFKYINSIRRPVGYQAQDIGMWEKALNFLSIFGHLVYAIKVIAYFVPNESISLKAAIARQKYLVKKKLKQKEKHGGYEKENINFNKGDSGIGTGQN